MMFDFFIFLLIQGLAINGAHSAMEEGMILHGYKKWLRKKKLWIGKPMGLCIRCMASVWSIFTFWPAVLCLYGWHPVEVFVWVVDMLALVSVNWFIYKNL